MKTTSIQYRSSNILTSTTIGLVSIAPGGFYWKPVPQPTPAPGPLPVFPDFPPVPTPPCFRVGDLFSIDCPPDHNKATTTFSSGPPGPTCMGKGCGKVCTANCGDDNDSECSTQTATNYFVSCSGTACQTTASSTITGCYVTPTATTTGDYCPAGLTLDPDDDQGDDSPTPTSTVLITTTLPPPPRSTTTVVVIVPAEPTPTSLNCKGSSLCGFIDDFVEQCDQARDLLVDSTLYG